MKPHKEPDLKTVSEIKAFLRRLKFQELLLDTNREKLKGFDRWAFLPGMLFISKKKWWAEGIRNIPHEGLDLCLFADKKGEIFSLPTSTRIPAPCDAFILATQKDYLGTSVFFTQIYRDQTPLLWAFGHMELEEGSLREKQIKQGQILGGISPHRSKNPAMLPHLHISIAVVLSQKILKEPGWDKLSDPNLARLVNPLCLFKGVLIARYLPQKGNGNNTFPISECP